MGDDTFDADRAILRGPNMFQRFEVRGDGEPLAKAGLAPDMGLMLVTRGGKTVALQVRQMVYHHVAQGRLAGEPYLVSF